MSLINQVLQDLDRRQAPRGAVPMSVRSVNGHGPGGRNMRLAALLGASGASAVLAISVIMVWHNAEGRAAQNATEVAKAVGVASEPRQAATNVPPPQTATAPVPGMAPSSTGSVAAAANADGMTLPDAANDLPPSIAAGTVAPITVVDGVPVVPAQPDGSPSSEASMAAASALASSDPTSPGTLVATAPTSAAVANAPRRMLDSSVEKSSRPLSTMERADLEYQRGIGLHQQGRTEEAIAAFAKALEEDSMHANTRQALAVAMVSKGNLDEAQKLLMQGIELNPRQAQLQLTLGRIKAQRQDVPGAIEAVKAALASSEGNSGLIEPTQARALLATLQQSAGRHAEAIENYAAALRQSPNNGSWWIGFGISLAADGKAESAREAFTRARATDTLTPELQQYVEQRLQTTP